MSQDFDSSSRDLTKRPTVGRTPETGEPFRLMVQAVVDYDIIMLDSEGLIATWNLGAERIKGYRAEEIIGQHFSVLYPPDAIEEKLPVRELAVASAQGRYQDEGWRIRRDGSRYYANVIINAIRNSDGTLIGFGHITRDLTEKRKAEERVKIADQKLRTLDNKKSKIAADLAKTTAQLDSILNASIFTSIIATDLDGTMTTFNHGAEVMLGYKSEEVIGKYTPALFHLAEEIELRGRSLSRLLNGPVHGFDVLARSVDNAKYDQGDWTYIHKDGHPVIVNLSLSSIQGKSGKTTGYLAVAVDVSERRLATNRLATASAKLNNVLECTSDCIMTISRGWELIYGNRKALEALPDFRIGEDYWDCFPYMLSTPAELRIRTAMAERSQTSYEDFFTPYKQWYAVQVFPTEDGLSVFLTNITEEKNAHVKLVQDQIQREQRVGTLTHMAGGLAHEISNPPAIIHARANDLITGARSATSFPSCNVQEAMPSMQKSNRNPQSDGYL